MNALKYILLILILLNIPAFGLKVLGPGFGSLSSALLLGCVILYYFLNKKKKPIIGLLALGISYYFISVLNYDGDFMDFIKDALRYFIFILGIREFTANTSKKELCIILIIGAISIAINALLFSDNYGRYSGFYLNPNRAGFICILGFALTYSLSNLKFKLLAQFIFTLCGIMTLSRSFILLFIVVNIISVFINKKNILTLFTGMIALIFIFSITNLKLNSDRFGALKSIFSDNVDTKTITNESRGETWALYIDDIMSNPLFGQGYKELHGKKKSANQKNIGVHNTYLMIIGEAGIIPFLIILYIYISLLLKSINYFQKDSLFLLISIILLASLMVSHNYFDNYILLFFTVWLYHKLNDEPSNSLIINTN